MGPEAILGLGLITWLACALPVSVLIGYCALGEEPYAHAPCRNAVPPGHVLAGLVYVQPFRRQCGASRRTHLAGRGAAS